MVQTILSVERTTRNGDRELGPLLVTTDHAIEEAGMGRALYVGMCPKNWLVTHLVHAIRNAQPSACIVIPHSYALGDEVREQLTKWGILCWSARRGNAKGNGDPGSSVHICIPEKLYMLQTQLESGLHPLIFHVVDPHGLMESPSLKYRGEFQARAQNVSQLKAFCEALGISPYVIVWTHQACDSRFQSDLCKLMGVDAWIYADGRTLRTASFAPETGSGTAVDQKHHWLDPYVHQAHANGSGIVLVHGGGDGRPGTAIADLAQCHGYPVINLATVVHPEAILANARAVEDAKLAIRRSLQRFNRQVCVLAGIESLWLTLPEQTTLELLSQGRSFTTVVAAVPMTRRAPLGHPKQVDCAPTGALECTAVVVDGGKGEGMAAGACQTHRLQSDRPIFVIPKVPENKEPFDGKSGEDVSSGTNHDRPGGREAGRPSSHDTGAVRRQ